MACCRVNFTYDYSTMKTKTCWSVSEANTATDFLWVVGLNQSVATRHWKVPLFICDGLCLVCNVAVHNITVRQTDGHIQYADRFLKKRRVCAFFKNSNNVTVI